MAASAGDGGDGKQGMPGCGRPGRGESQGCFLGCGFVQSDGDAAIHSGRKGAGRTRWELALVGI